MERMWKEVVYFEGEELIPTTLVSEQRLAGFVVFHVYCSDVRYSRHLDLTTPDARPAMR